METGCYLKWQLTLPFSCRLEEYYNPYEPFVHALWAFSLYVGVAVYGASQDYLCKCLLFGIALQISVCYGVA
jgi:hypothetical protein